MEAYIGMIRQRERGLAVAAVGRAQDREQRRVLRDRKQLSLTEQPATRGEVAGKDGDLARTMSNLKALVDPRFNEDDVTVLLVKRTAA
jgi:hypothetical protein